jgi:hypothetical protein
LNICIIIKNFYFIKNLFYFFINKKKIYLYNSYLVDDYRYKINSNPLTIFNHKEEQSITEKSTAAALKKNHILLKEIKKKKYFLNLVKKFDERIFLAAKKHLFYLNYDQIRLEQIKINLERKYEKKIFFFTIENIINDSIQNLAHIFYLLLKFLFHNVNYKYLLHRTKKKKYKLAYHVNNPSTFFKKKEELEMILKLKNKNTFLLIESNWGNFSEETKERIKKNNFCYANDCKIQINFDQLINKVLVVYFHLFFLIFKEIIKFKIDKFLLTYVRVKLDLLNINLFFDKYKINNFISRDDFAPIHILRTLVMEKAKCSNIGISHSNFLHISNSINNHFKCFTKYFVSSFVIPKMFKNTWKCGEQINIGSLNGYKVLKYLNDQKLKNKIETFYGKKKIILLLLSVINKNYTFDLFDTNKKKLLNIFKLLKHDKDLIFVIKPRSSSRVYEFVSGLNCFKKYKERIFIDIDNFETQELMAHSQFIVAPATSAAIFESLYNQKICVLPLNMRSIEKIFWSIFPTIKVFDSSEDLNKFFFKFKMKAFLEKYKKKYSLIRKEFCRDLKNPITIIKNNL